MKFLSQLYHWSGTAVDMLMYTKWWCQCCVCSRVKTWLVVWSSSPCTGLKWTHLNDRTLQYPTRATHKFTSIWKPPLMDQVLFWPQSIPEQRSLATNIPLPSHTHMPCYYSGVILKCYAQHNRLKPSNQQSFNPIGWVWVWWHCGVYTKAHHSGDRRLASTTSTITL